MNVQKKLVVVVLVLMMMVTAVAYAAWSDTIQINGTVSTGEFDVQWSTTSAVSKSSGATEGSISVIRDANDVDLLGVSIANAKPGDTYTITAISENEGSLSAVYKGLAITGSSSTPAAAEWINVGTPVDVTFKIGTDDAYKVSTSSNTAMTLVPKSGENTDKQTFTFTITILDTANQDTLTNTGNFYIHFNYAQQ